MSTIQIVKKWQPEPQKTLVEDHPVQEGEKFSEQVKCVICSTSKRPYLFGHEEEPLVFACPKCGHKSWAISIC